MFTCLPDDDRIQNMDSVQKIWMYYNWIEDQKDKSELAQQHAMLIASFDHPEAVRQMTQATVHSSTDEEMEESIKIMERINADFDKKHGKDLSTPKRKRRQIIRD